MRIFVLANDRYDWASEIGTIVSKAILAATVIFGMFVLAGCGVHDTPGCYGGCALAPGISPAILIYPVSGATAISDASVTVLVAAPSSNGVLSIAPAISPAVGSSIVATNSFVAIPSPLPAPHTAVPPGDTLYAFTYTSLAAHMQYTVVFPSTSGCSSYTCDVGTFTTQ